mmetsp:Transcript_43636/g.89115  ORF Transcript_43636/g.89115 Transcript_43636/m.89115 type:complete len:282 (+) Transcript_43636:54-899(+)
MPGRRPWSALAILLCLTLGGHWHPLAFSQGGDASIVLTRQAGENGKLKGALEEALREKKLSADLVEVPCIEHATGPDLEALQAYLSSSGELEMILLTSPEAARVFGDAASPLRSSTKMPLRVASVGKGTSVVARSLNLEVVFEPSKANAETMASELPEELGPKLLYAASSIAPGTLQEGLEKRGFQVTRYNTYTTRPVEKHSPDALALMEKAQIATFGSPSAVKAWSQATKHRPLAACIGQTSHDAAKAAGFERIYSPEKPGIPGWAQVTVEALQDLRQMA